MEVIHPRCAGIDVSKGDAKGCVRVQGCGRKATAPEGDDPEIADIGYYAPSQDLVLYYGDVGYWNGIVRIGRFDSDQLSLVEDQPDGFDVTLEIV